MIKKGDNVIVISGKDKGKTGKVERAFPQMEKVLILGINLQKKHQRPKKGGQKGQVIEKPMPVHVSNVMILDPKTNKPTRVGKKLVKDRYVRVAKSSGMEL